MSGYYVACPRCTNQLYDDGQLAGELVMCPHCTQQFLMPTREVAGQRALEILPVPSSTRSSRQRKRTAGLPVYQQLLFGGIVTIIGMALLASLRGNLSNGIADFAHTDADNDLVIEQERLQSKIGNRIDLDELKREWRLSRSEVIELGESIRRVLGPYADQDKANEIKRELNAIRNARGTSGMLKAAPDYASMRLRGINERSSAVLKSMVDVELLADIKRGSSGPVSEAVRRDHRERKPG